MNAAAISRFHSEISAASRQGSVRRRSMSSSRRSIRDGFFAMRVREKRHRTDYPGSVGVIRIGPSGLPEAERFGEAAEMLAAAGYRACEISFVHGFWLDYESAPELGEAMRARDVLL